LAKEGAIHAVTEAHLDTLVPSENHIRSRFAVEKLKQYGLSPGQYTKVVVKWDWMPEEKALAEAEGVELWDFRRLMREIDESIRG
jgi:hypothetical protein